LVRQYDAHAWAEIWLPQRGWIRVDPTAAVAPERIRDGLQTAAAEEFMQDALLPLHKIAFVTRLRLQWDMINYRWYQTVVSFDQERQEGLLTRLLGEVSPLRLALLLGLPVVLALAVLLLWLHLSSRAPALPTHSRLYLRFCQRMREFLDSLRREGYRVALCGDFNIAHTELDLANPKTNRDNAGFLPEERAWLDALLAGPYIDAFRAFEPGPGHYTWWSYRPTVRERNIGWRIDHFVISDELRGSLRAAYHQPEVTGSDHCPISIELNLRG